MVLHDVIEGYVSIEEAKSEYGVVIDPTTLEIDTEETDRLRKSKQERF